MSHGVASVSSSPVAASVAGAAASGTGGASSYLQCPLCLDEFSATDPKLQPRLLPSCAHSLCTRCLRHAWSAQSASRAHPTFLCPLDGLPARVTQVDALPVNAVLLALADMMSATNTRARDFRVGEHARPRCVEDGCTAPAAWHCFSDEADMCDAHKQASHDGLKSNLTKSHRLCRIEEKEAQRGPAMCASHHSALLLWCTECRVHACHACATLQPHVNHPAALKLLGGPASHASAGGTGLGAPGDSYYSEQQAALVAGVADEERRMKVAMEKEAKELVQAMQVIDSNELHTQQTLDTEFDNLIASLEQRRSALHSELRRQSTAARTALDARLLRVSLNHALTNTVLEEGSRVAAMSPYAMSAYTEGLLARHEKSLATFWEVSHEESLVTWFPLRLAKDLLTREVEHLGTLGVPSPPIFRDEECRADDDTIEIAWEPVTTTSNGGAAKEDLSSGVAALALASPLHRSAMKPSLPSPVASSTTTGGTASLSAVSSASSTSAAFYIVHLSPLDPLDLAQDRVAFLEVYRGPHTSAAIGGLQPGTAYLLRVQAVSLMGEGVWSRKICITTLGGGRGVRAEQEPVDESTDAHHQVHLSHFTAPTPAAAPISPPRGSYFGSGGGGGGGANGFQTPAPAFQQAPTPYATGFTSQSRGGAGREPDHAYAPPSPNQQAYSQQHIAYQPTASHQQYQPRQQQHQQQQQQQQQPYASHQYPSHHSPLHQQQQSPSHLYHQQQHQQPSNPNSYASMPSSAFHSVAVSRRPSVSQHPSSSTAPHSFVDSTVNGGGVVRPSSVPAAAVALVSHPASVRTAASDLWKLSVILREKDVAPLMRFFQPLAPSSFQLLYRASRDGMSTGAYHLHVDGRGPTLTVVRVKKDNRDYVFGGFARESWSSGAAAAGATPQQGHWIASRDAWLFSLINAYRRNLKFRVRAGQEKFAQYCDAKHAAMFGVGGDLSLLDPLDASHHRFGVESFEHDAECDARSGLPPFALPPNANGAFSATMLTGGEVFQCKEVECYAVNLDA